MKTYSVLPSQIAAWRRRTYIITLVALIAASIILVVPQVNSLSVGSITPLVVAFAVLLVVTYRRIRQGEAVWRSIKVEMGGNFIARTQLHVPQVRIMRDEVTSIEEIDGGLCLRTADVGRSLAIPDKLTDNGFEEICAVLSTWAPIKPKLAGRNWRGLALVGIVLIGVAAMLLSPWLWLELLAGIGLTAFNGWYYIQLRRSEGVDPKFKRNALITLLLFPVLTGVRALSYLAL
jgi:hypothetical protein